MDRVTPLSNGRIGFARSRYQLDYDVTVFGTRATRRSFILASPRQIERNENLVSSGVARKHARSKVFAVKYSLESRNFERREFLSSRIRSGPTEIPPCSENTLFLSLSLVGSPRFFACSLGSGQPSCEILYQSGCPRDRVVWRTQRGREEGGHGRSKRSPGAPKASPKRAPPTPISLLPSGPRRGVPSRVGIFQLIFFAPRPGPLAARAAPDIDRVLVYTLTRGAEGGRDARRRTPRRSGRGSIRGGL